MGAANQLDRRSVLATLPAAITTVNSVNSVPAWAGEGDAIAVFAAAYDEAAQGIGRLDGMIEREAYDEILKYTKEFDLSFRKVTMKTAADSLDGAAKAEAKEIRSRMTLELQAVNRAARPSTPPSKAGATAAMDQVKLDLENFSAWGPNK
eukprot:CAMPEP_0205939604 /NCGR_PEP_ID=MMETSP1325-20131115/50048_1 /ASSEMBLY_ACC=CAM_ASM_000708 /TAXON_ID=236786 /ORGANISM="Florenciella sp., Strain RCC1007" /LENGTH=149 /DNA_ID=CAMNT_0053310083 /DNA_START=22 /DNA_END=469 /DNA_ORIENTATION=+